MTQACKRICTVSLMPSKLYEPEMQASGLPCSLSFGIVRIAT